MKTISQITVHGTPIESGVAGPLPETAKIANGHLTVGGVDCVELAREFGTPLHVVDVQHVRSALSAYKEAFTGFEAGVDIAFACKSMCTRRLLEVVVESGVGADVASEGELAIATRSGVTPEQIVMHGNNKSRSELTAGVETGVGYIVVDSSHELDLLESVVAEQSKVQKILVRITPGIDAETHRYIKTAHTGSKFGVDPEDGLALLARAAENPLLDACGVHVHLGSQLTSLAPWKMVIEWLAQFAATARMDYGIAISTVDLGGGLGISYVPDHPVPPIDELADEVIRSFTRAWSAVDAPLPHLIVEPGRSIVGAAGITLYELGTIKQAGPITWVNVDGGMSDNPRPMLYQAEYTGMLANRIEDETDGRFWVCGKHCESGDVLIEDARLPEPNRGDILAVIGTGAYNQSMASNYNAIPRAAVVGVMGGDASIWVRREKIEDLWLREC